MIKLNSVVVVVVVVVVVQLTEIKSKLIRQFHRKCVIIVFLFCCLFTYKKVGEALKHT